ncbi:L,D-transpeptidase, partial [Salmonella enterica subsp. enterica serovar Istanbul]|nr:L,D-transpeptidase [Salmonella enterica subsp. enterica serovar Istanbul]
MQRKSTLILLTSITLVIGLLAVGTVKVVGDAHRPSQST